MFAVPENTIAPMPAANPLLRHPVRIALEFASDRDRWRNLLRYDPDERFAALLERTEAQEVWLLSWLPGQHAEPHDHGETTGAFTVVSGQLTETVYRRAPDGRVLTEVHTPSTGQSRVFGPGYVHQVRNGGPDPAISVHVYRSGGRTMRPYHLDPLTGPVRD
ncbi:cysteine dioxygenase [Prauserella muralis]|uniref:Cysteine dioxygenase n=1 Tax=Prauserella muralis TaxID=588067 RepID=A0A2V4AYS5_9PSEU|nr:cysteine dioxygenase family protein [Prauserella muralis]PXY27054.1 cysteine dioxygenase [Prauserella muralis]TWE23318.1 cysteine dioxygenase type I [Prauserella muralis]